MIFFNKIAQDDFFMYDYPSHRLHCHPVSSVAVTLDGVATASSAQTRRCDRQTVRIRYADTV